MLSQQPLKQERNTTQIWNPEMFSNFLKPTLLFFSCKVNLAIRFLKLTVQPHMIAFFSKQLSLLQLTHPESWVHLADVGGALADGRFTTSGSGSGGLDVRAVLRC